MNARLTSGTLKLMVISSGRNEDEAEGLRALPGDFLLIEDVFLLDRITAGKNGVWRWRIAR